MDHFLHSFTFFIKERNILFAFISHTKIANLSRKECKRMQCSFLKVTKQHSVLFSIYIYISIEKRTEHSAFFFKRMKHSCILLHSLQKNIAFFAKECCILLGLISHQILEKRTECSLKEWIRTELSKWKRKECSVRKRTWCPTLLVTHLLHLSALTI